jgi:hypothetical protein
MQMLAFVYKDCFKFIICELVPADFSERAKVTMRDCAWRAGLLEFFNSPNLEFTTERRCFIHDMHFVTPIFFTTKETYQNQYH